MKNNLLATATFVGLLLALSTPASAGEHGQSGLISIRMVMPCGAHGILTQ
jgi:hypothetical protein